jgi:hypothetical protein
VEEKLPRWRGTPASQTGAALDIGSMAELLRRDRRKPMARKLVVASVSAALVALSPTAFADPSGGTADEAKAMLMKAVAAVKADKVEALDMFNKGEGGFLDRDLYVFCIDLVGKEVAIGNPNTRKNLGNNVRAAKDSTGKPFGLEIYAAVQKAEGQVTEVTYVWPRTGTDKTPVPKVTFVTRVSDDLGCGVGYYK